jgi:hypothetical protein
MKRSKVGLLASGFLCLWGALSAQAAEPIAPEQFARLHALIKPAASEEKWASIPWQTNLWQARKVAAAQGKPILLWEMDGHPLGCT